MAGVRLEWSIKEINLQINNYCDEKKFRPTVVMVVVNKLGQFLLVQSVKGDNLWGFPQGGVNPKECVTSAIHRELEEEVGIANKQADCMSYVGSNRVIKPDWSGRDGFTDGKVYFYFTVSCPVDAQIKLNPEELRDHRFLGKDEVIKNISTGNNEKLQSIKQAMDDALSRLRQA